MQNSKVDIQKRILDTARKEFLENGFKDTSMRKIAKESEVVLSNIYNYFKNKDEIFCEVLSQVLRAINKVSSEHNESDQITIEVFTSDEFIRSNIDSFVELIDNYKEDFKLLLFKSSGSSLENFTNDFVDKQTKVGIEYLALMKQTYPELNEQISEFFIRTMSSWWINMIAELVMHDLSYEELEKFIREYIEFQTAGWKKLMQVN